MLWVKLGTHIIDHPRFLKLGAPARDLWSWGMLYSGSHDLDGAIPLEAVMLSAWGRGDRGNVKLASTLVEAGLWERTDSGYQILRWSEQGNQTKAQIVAKRASTAARVSRFRNGVTNGVSNAFSSTSTSNSLSGSLSGSQIASPPAKVSTRTLERLTASEQILEAPELSPLLRAMVAQVCEPAGVTLDADHEWLTYMAHCGREARQVTPAGWKYWLCNAAKFAKRDRVRDQARASVGGGKGLVQSGDNRAWKFPEGLE